MDYIKQWTLSVCITLIAAVILSLISPQGSMGRFYKAIISLFIVTSFILPLTGFNSGSFNIRAQNIKSYVADSQPYDKSVELTVKKSLSDNGFTSCAVNAQTSCKGDEIYIDKLTVSCPSEYNKDEVSAFLYDKLGIIAEVKYPGE